MGHWWEYFPGGLRSPFAGLLDALKLQAWSGCGLPCLWLFVAACANSVRRKRQACAPSAGVRGKRGVFLSAGSARAAQRAAEGSAGPPSGGRGFIFFGTRGKVERVFFTSSNQTFDRFARVCFELGASEVVDQETGEREMRFKGTCVLPLPPVHGFNAGARRTA